MKTRSYPADFLQKTLKDLDQLEIQRLILLNEIAMYGFNTLNFPLAERYINLAHEQAPEQIDILLNKAKIDIIVNPENVENLFSKIENVIQKMPQNIQESYFLHLDFTKAKYYLFFKKFDLLRKLQKNNVETKIVQAVGEAVQTGHSLVDILKNKYKVDPYNSEVITFVLQLMLDGGFVFTMYDFVKEIEHVFDSTSTMRSILLPLAKIQKLKLLGHHEKAFQIVKDIYESTMHPNAKEEYEYFLQATKRFKEYWNIKREKHIVNLASALGIPKFKKDVDAKGKTILLVTDQGFGDNIQNIRYIKAIYDRFPDSKIVVSVFKELFPLFTENLPFINKENIILYDTNAIQQTNADFHLFFSEIPEVLNLDAEDMEKMGEKTRIKVEDPVQYERPTIGIFWKTTIRDNVTRIKNIDLEEFLDLVKKSTDLEEYDIVSLQKEGITDREREIMERYNIKDVSKNLSSFKETARYVQNMEEVHSIDSAVAHLGGAMHKKTFCYINGYRDWRWGEQKGYKTKSYLYPKLFIVSKYNQNSSPQ